MYLQLPNAQNKTPTQSQVFAQYCMVRLNPATDDAKGHLLLGTNAILDQFQTCALCFTFLSSGCLPRLC